MRAFSRSFAFGGNPLQPGSNLEIAVRAHFYSRGVLNFVSCLFGCQQKKWEVEVSRLSSSSSPRLSWAYYFTRKKNKGQP